MGVEGGIARKTILVAQMGEEEEEEEEARPRTRGPPATAKALSISIATESYTFSRRSATNEAPHSRQLFGDLPLWGHPRLGTVRI